jgi:hypothetical protein
LLHALIRLAVCSNEARSTSKITLAIPSRPIKNHFIPLFVLCALTVAFMVLPFVFCELRGPGLSTGLDSLFRPLLARQVCRR